MGKISKLYWLRTEKKDLQARIEEIESKIQELSVLSSAPISDMPHGSEIGNPTEKYVIKLTNLKEQRQKLVLQSAEIESETEEYIKEVDDSEIRTIMRSYYIDGMSWNKIARKYYSRNCDGSTPRKKVNMYLEKEKYGTSKKMGSR